MAEIRLENLSKVYSTRRGDVRAVESTSLSIVSGELFFLLGPSGCGKTTLLRMLAGFVEPSGGRILFDGRDVTALPPERRDTAMVFQSYALWPHMTVAQNVGYGPRIHGVHKRQRRETVRELLDIVRIADKAAAKPMELSGGQQQRVALARALAVRPACLLLDEPLSNLDAALRAAMRWEIRRIVKSAGMTGVYVTHDQAEALAIADRIALMRDGRIVQTGTGRELYENPANRFVAAFLGEANFVTGAPVGDGSRGQVAVDTPIGRLIGRAAGDLSGCRQVTCCIRPESLRLAPADAASPPETNQVGGQLSEWVHLGESARFRVKVGEMELSGAAMPARRTLPVGAVQVQISRDDVVVVGE